MKLKQRAFIQGMGSVFVLSPATNYQAILPKQSVAQRMAHNFAHVGMALTRASGYTDQDGQTTDTPKTHAR